MTTREDKPTAMRREYQKVRAAHPGRVIFWQKGDFFETYEDDAKLAASVLDLQLTTGSFGQLKVPTAGVPVGKVSTFLQRLVDRGYQVVLVEEREGALAAHQRADRRQVDRVVTRVLTPGTVVEPEFLDARTNTFLAAVLVEGEAAGAAYCDVSTGAFAATELRGPDAPDQLSGELQRLQPAEILTPDDARLRPAGLVPQRGQLAHDLAPTARADRDRLLPHERVAQIVAGRPPGDWVQGQVTAWPTWRWDHRTTVEALQQHFQTASLAGFGLHDRPLATRAAGAILQYLQETQRGACAHIERVHWYNPARFMFLDPPTRRNLELLTSAGATRQGTLIDVLDQTVTPMGARLLRTWVAEPLTDLAAIAARQEVVAGFVTESVLRAEMRVGLKPVGDLERTAARVLQGTAIPRDLSRLREGLRAVPSLAQRLAATGLAQRGAEAPPELVLDDGADDGDRRAGPAAGELDPCDDVLALLEAAMADVPPALLGTWDPLHEENVIRRGYDPSLEQLVQASATARTWIAGLEEQERAATALQGLRVTDSAQGWAIVLPRNTPPRLIPPRYREVAKLTGEWRFTTTELEEYDRILAAARVRLNELERTVFERLVAQVAAAGERLRTAARLLAMLDVQAALADVAVRGKYVRPQLTTGTELHILGGRHPVVEQTLDEPFVPNTTPMATDAAQLLIITGPNMAGKSTYLRQVALIVLLAQLGSFVPAEAAQIGLVDRIFTRIGAQDDIATGQSTFMVEMSETANILHHATPRSLIVLDELGRHLGVGTADQLRAGGAGEALGAGSFAPVDVAGPRRNGRLAGGQPPCG